MDYELRIVAGSLPACLSADAVWRNAVWRDLPIAENRSHRNATATNGKIDCVKHVAGELLFANVVAEWTGVSKDCYGHPTVFKWTTLSCRVYVGHN